MTVALVPQLWPHQAAAMPSHTQVLVDPSLHYHNPDRECTRTSPAARKADLLAAMVYGLPCVCWEKGR